MRPIAKLAAGAGLAALILGGSIGLVRLAGIDLIGDLHSPDQPSIGIETTGADAGTRIHVFPTAINRYHPIGHKDGLGWAVTPRDRANEFLVYGPYTGAISPGGNVATFRIMIDNVTAEDARVLNLDVRDANANKLLGELPILRSQFKKPLVYQDFDLPFVAPSGGRLEFRTYYLGGCSVNQQHVTITPHPSTTWVFPTADSPYHRLGRADGLGWSAQNAGNDFLNYGPYTNVVGPGLNVATFRLMVDDMTGDDIDVVNLDVNDPDKNKVLAELRVTRHQFKMPSVYQDFDLMFYAPRRARLEFRTYYFGPGYVNQQQVTVAPAPANLH
jgi:hypothetical protein